MNEKEMKKDGGVEIREGKKKKKKRERERKSEAWRGDKGEIWECG